MEIERKFLIDTLPENLASWPSVPIEQAYLCTDPVVRVRRSGEEYYLTCKGPGLLEREECNLTMTRETYLHMLTKAEGNVISKVRYAIPFGGYTIELDVFAPPFAPLVVAEVEFPTVEEAQAFQPPAWFGREVTWDKGYTNASLSARGLPPGWERPGE